MTTMNSLVRRIEGNWDDIMGEIKHRWGKLTDDDLKKMNGSYQQLVGKLEKLYGYSQDEIEEKLHIFVEKLKLKDINSMAGNIQEKTHESIEKIWEMFKTKTENLQEGIYCYVRGNPLKIMSAASAALAIGIVINMCFRKDK